MCHLFPDTGLVKEKGTDIKAKSFLQKVFIKRLLLCIMLPRVLIGSPVSDYYDYCFEEFVKSRKSLSYQNHDLLFVDNSKDESFAARLKDNGLHVTRIAYKESIRQRMVDSRNLLRKKVLEEGYDYFLNLDQDIIPPNDIIERLLGHNKKIVNGVYFVYAGQYSDGSKDALEPMCTLNENGRVRRLNEHELAGNQLIRIWSTGTGCILIHRDVLKEVEFRFDEFFAFFDDIWFSRDVGQKGFEMFVDTSIKCRHLIARRNWEWKEKGWW